MKWQIALLLVTFFNSLYVSKAQNPLLDRLGFAGKAALFAIKNLCGDEPPVACTCAPDEDDKDDEDDEIIDGTEDDVGKA